MYLLWKIYINNERIKKVDPFKGFDLRPPLAAGARVVNVK